MLKIKALHLYQSVEECKGEALDVHNARDRYEAAK